LRSKPRLGGVDELGKQIAFIAALTAVSHETTHQDKRGRGDKTINFI